MSEAVCTVGFIYFFIFYFRFSYFFLDNSYTQDIYVYIYPKDYNVPSRLSCIYIYIHNNYRRYELLLQESYILFYEEVPDEFQVSVKHHQ